MARWWHRYLCGPSTACLWCGLTWPSQELPYRLDSESLFVALAIGVGDGAQEADASGVTRL